MKNLFGKEEYERPKKKGKTEALKKKTSCQHGAMLKTPWGYKCPECGYQERG